MMEFYAFYDSGRKYYLRIGGFTIVRKPSIQIILDPPRMQRCIREDSELHHIVDSFAKAGELHGGDPIAINLIKEICIMAKNKVLVIDTTAKRVTQFVASAEKGAEFVKEHGGVVVTNADEFAALAEDVRLAIAATNADVATLPADEQLARAYEIACKPVKVAKEKPAPKVRTKGVKTLIRELFAVPGARHSVDDICKLTEGTKVSVTTAISDLRSPTYCKPGDVLNLTRLADGMYGHLSTGEAEKLAADTEKAKEAAAAAKKAEADAVKAKKAAEAAVAKLEADKAKPAEAKAAPAAKPAKAEKAK